jgi:hypothetical protein
MALRWRLALMLVAVAAVVAGFMPHGALAGARTSAAETLQAVEVPLSEPVACLDATCGKGSATPSAPTPAVALAAVLGGLAITFAAAIAIRRRPSRVAALPSGVRDPLYHPPQFS